MFCVHPKKFHLLSVCFHVETVVQPYLQIYNLNFPSGYQWEWTGGKDEQAAFFNFLSFLNLSCNKAILKSVLGLQLCWILFHSYLVSHIFSFLFKISKEMLDRLPQKYGSTRAHIGSKTHNFHFPFKRGNREYWVNAGIFEICIVP